MLSLVSVPPKNINLYKNLVKQSLLKEIESASKKLQKKKIIFINSTSQGGGVAEIMQGIIPLMQGLKINAQWFVIPPNKEFFNLTKQIHNALQGKPFAFKKQQKDFYCQYLKKVASQMSNMEADLWLIHDIQPLGLISFLPNIHPVISHIHIDTSNPYVPVWSFIKTFLSKYDRIIFSNKNFIHQGLPKNRIKIFPPGIDPLSKKNKKLDLAKAKKILSKVGINTKKPLISQVSRFDPWKDPLGVINIYRTVQNKFPDVQLALVGIFLAKDDPEAEKIYQQVKNKVKEDKNIFLFSNLKQLPKDVDLDTFINAVQTASDVIIQNSKKEGFGLSCTEAMWKENVVVARPVGGLKIQIQDKKSGFLAENPKQIAQQIIRILENPDLKKKIGKAAKQRVQERFLIIHLLRNYLKLFNELI